MKKKKVISTILAGTMVLSMVTGCGSPSTGNKESAKGDASGGKEFSGVTLTMMRDTDTSDEGMNAVLDLAKEKLGIEVDMETRVGGQEGDNIIKTRLASGDMTDITLYNSGSLLSALNPEQYFVDITDQDFVSTYDDTYKSTVTVDEKVYGVPLETTQGGAVMYNKKDYEELGLEVPKTWDEFLENCEALKKAGKTALIGTFGDSWTSQVLFLGDNYNIVASNPDFPEEFTKGKAKFASTLEGVESFQKYVDLLPYYNEDYLNAKYEDGCQMLANGEGSQWIMLTQALGNINSEYPEMMDDMGIFAIPGESVDKNGLTVWYPSSWYINKNSENADAALALMELWVSAEGIEAYAEARMPNGPSCIKDISLGEEVPEAVREDMQKYFDEGNTLPALEFLTPVKGSNCMAITQEVGSGQTTAEEAANKYDEDCKKQAVQLGLNW